MAFRSFLYVALFALIMLTFDGSVYAKEFGLTRETIIENHNRRQAQLEKLLEETKEAVAGHEAGTRKLEEGEYETFTKRIGLYERKLSKMKEGLSEHEIKRTMERQKMREERRHREL